MWTNILRVGLKIPAGAVAFCVFVCTRARNSGSSTVGGGGGGGGGWIGMAIAESFSLPKIIISSHTLLQCVCDVTNLISCQLFYLVTLIRLPYALGMNHFSVYIEGSLYIACINRHSSHSSYTLDQLASQM